MSVRRPLTQTRPNLEKITVELKAVFIKVWGGMLVYQ